MVAAEYGAFEFQRLQKLRHLGKQFLLVQRLPLRKSLAKSRLTLGKADHQGGQKFRLGQVDQACRVGGVLL
jgi:hypothetical protein